MAAKQVRHETEPPRTLMQAHEAVSRVRPAPDADLVTRKTFHQWSARLYAMVADVDRGHHHEALYWVSYEQGNAAEIAEQIKKGVRQQNNPQ